MLTTSSTSFIGNTAYNSSTTSFSYWGFPSLINIIQYKGQLKTPLLELRKRNIRKSYVIDGWVFLAIPEQDVIYGIDEIDNIIQQTPFLTQSTGCFSSNTYYNRNWFCLTPNLRMIMSQVIIDVVPGNFNIFIRGVVPFLEDSFLDNLQRYLLSVPGVQYCIGSIRYVWDNYKNRDYNINEIYKRVLRKTKSLSCVNTWNTIGNGDIWKWRYTVPFGGSGLTTSTTSQILF